MTRELNIICEACNKPINGGDDDPGDLWIAGVDVDRYQADVAAWKAKYEPDPDGFNVLGWMDIVNHPNPARWRAHHEACNNTALACMYSIDAARLLTWADLSTLTADLLGKTWFADTDWRRILRGVPAGKDPRIVQIDKPVPKA